MSMPDIRTIVHYISASRLSPVLSAQLHSDLIEQAIILKRLWMCGAGNVVE